MAPLPFILLTIFESLLIVAAVSLFSYGYPERTRLALWEEGGLQHFNSDPALRIYFFANHRTPPAIPYIWSQRSTDLNLSIALLTFWIFIARSTLRILHVLSPSTELFLQCCLLPFWIASLKTQQLPDLTDEKYLSRVPWYLTHSCGIVAEERGVHRIACRVGQASFVVTGMMVCFYACWIWRTIAYAGLEYWSKKFQGQRRCAEGRSKEGNEVGEEVTVMVEDWSDDESPLMRAWDNV